MSLRRKGGHEGIPFPGHTCGKDSSSFMMGSTILRAECETSQVIQQVLYFPPTLINYKLPAQQSFSIPDINLLCRSSAEGRDQPLSCVSGAKHTWKLLFHRKNPISGLQTDWSSILCQSSVCLISPLRWQGQDQKAINLSLLLLIKQNSSANCRPANGPEALINLILLHWLFLILSSMVAAFLLCAVCS